MASEDEVVAFNIQVEADGLQANRTPVTRTLTVQHPAKRSERFALEPIMAWPLASMIPPVHVRCRSCSIAQTTPTDGWPNTKTARWLRLWETMLVQPVCVTCL